MPRHGDDELIGKGGADVLCGREGDDILAISDATIARLKGGTGTDTLRFDGAGVTLDLTALSDLTIEEIDLQVGVGSHDLTLDLQEVLNISDSSNTLTILGGGRDSLLGSKLPMLTMMCTTDRNGGHTNLNSTDDLLLKRCKYG